MSNQINDGGPAFARDSHMDKQIGLYVQQQGMSLRDYFAAAALSSMDAIRELNILESGKENSQMAQRAYRIADAMLKAREVKP